MHIGVLSARAGLTTKTIRFYEDTGLLPPPPRTPAGYRDYPAQTLTRLRFIRNAQAAGLTLAEIRGILAIRDHGQAPCQHVTALIDQHLAQVQQRLAELTQAQNILRDLKHRAVGTDPAACTSEEVCTILTPVPQPGH
jgi:DNA-binding transcriptional MerR regulator